MRGPHATPRLILSRNMAGVIEAGTAGVLAAACAVIFGLFNSIQPQPYMVSITLITSLSALTTHAVPVRPR